VVIAFRGCLRGLQHGAMERGVTPPEVPASSKSNPQGEEQVLGLDSLVVRDDDVLTRPFQVMSKGLDSPSVLRRGQGTCTLEGPQHALSSNISIHRKIERVELSSP
jgi:hypothetical protein